MCFSSSLSPSFCLGLFQTRYYESFSLSFEDTSVLEHKDKTCFAVAPHGIFTCGWAILYARPEFAHVYFLMAKAMVVAPLFRIVTLLTGRPGDVSKGPMTAMMKQGKVRPRAWLARRPGGPHLSGMVHIFFILLPRIVKMVLLLNLC